MLIEPAENTFHPLTYEFDGVTYTIMAYADRAYVPSALGMALVRAGLVRVIDAEAEPPGDPWLSADRYAPWLIPSWPTRH
jgi:hypothetical protein